MLTQKKMLCIICDSEIPDRAKFCPKCKSQIKCVECNAVLEKGSEICIECGFSVQKVKNENMNTVEYSESKNSRKFKANFTNEVGQGIGEAFGIVLKGNLNNRKPLKLSKPDSIENEDSENETIDTEYQQVEETLGDRKIQDIFRKTGDKTTLYETRLKAQSKRDYSIRLTLLFLYYRQQNKEEQVPRSDLTSILKDASIEDANWRRWLRNNNLVSVHDDFVELTAPGREQAKTVLQEVFDTEIEDKWKLGTSKPLKRGKKKEKKENG